MRRIRVGGLSRRAVIFFVGGFGGGIDVDQGEAGVAEFEILFWRP